MDKNKFRQAIRESFTVAYQQHKAKKLNENADQLGAALSAEEKAKANDVIDILINKKPGFDKIKWSPQGSKGLTHTELNYIIEMLLELYKNTRENKYKEALGIIYSPFAETSTYNNPTTKDTTRAIKYPDIYYYLLNKLRTSTPIDKLMQGNHDAFYDLLTRSWGRMFAGGKIAPKGAAAGARVDYFENLVDSYTSSGSNFGAFIVEYLFRDVRNLINKTAREKQMEIPVDARKRNIHADEENENDSEVDYAEDELQSKYKTGHPELQVEKFKKAIGEIIEACKKQGIGNEAALVALMEVAIHHLNYDEIKNKHPELFATRKPGDILRDLIFKNKPFQKLSNNILAKYKLQSLSSANIQGLFKAGKEIKKPDGVSVEDEDDNDNYVWQEFLNRNIHLLAERVLLRLERKYNLIL